MTRPTGYAHHKLRLTPDLIVLGTLYAVAVSCHRHRDQVQRYCAPIACDVVTRLPLYDVIAADDRLRKVPRRVGRVA